MPIDTSLLPVFLAAVLLLMITPGPDMVFVTANALGGGRKAGLASLMGVATGAYIHIMAAALGLSTILMASDFIFNVVRFAGAAYIAWVGFCFLRSKSSFQKIDTAKRKPLISIYRQGVLTNLLNPKAALFTVSFVPQFVSADIGPIWQQTMILGLLIVAVMILVELPIVLASGKFAELIVTNATAADRLGKLIGFVLLALAAYVAFARKPA